MKSIFKIISMLAVASIFLITLSTEAQIDFEKDCVGMWFFDEGSGKVAKDSSGNKNDGSLKGNAKWGKGKFGNALHLKVQLLITLKWLTAIA